MNEILNNIKSDLLDRRLMPLVAIVVLALLAALGYAILGGGSSQPTASVAPAPVAQGAGALLVAPAQATSTDAVAETTSGAAVQRHGRVHDPFDLLPGAVARSTTTTATGSSSSSGSNSSSSSTAPTSSSGGTSTGSTPSSKETAPRRRKTTYEAKLLFGELPPGVAPSEAKLTPYTLRKPTPLPNAKEKRIEVVGVTVTKNGKGGLFALSGEVILHGPGICLPSSTQCEVLKLQEGKTEQLEFLPPNGGATVVYELRVVSIEGVSASASAARRIAAAQARVARALSASDTGPLRYSSLRWAADAGAFVPGHAPFSGR